MKSIKSLFFFSLLSFINALEEILPGDTKDLTQMRDSLGKDFKKGSQRDILKWIATSSKEKGYQLKCYIAAAFEYSEVLLPCICLMDEKNIQIYDTDLNKIESKLKSLNIDCKSNSRYIECQLLDYCKFHESELKEIDTKKANNKKWWIIGGVVVALVVVAGVGYYLYSENQDVKI